MNDLIFEMVELSLLQPTSDAFTVVCLKLLELNDISICFDYQFGILKTTDDAI